MAAFIDASHNLLFRLDPDRWREDLRKSSQGHITGYQEGGGQQVRQTVREFCEQNNRGLYYPDGSSNPISWDRNLFTAIPRQKWVIQVHAKHPTANLMPARDITARGLTHVSTGMKVLRINIHPLAGATDPTPEEKPDISAYMNWGLGQYYLDLIAFTATQMSRDYWDAILLGGDYNGDLLKQRDDQWYYPSRILDSLYAPDSRLGGLDHLQHTHGSDVKPGRRWVESGHTDHKLQFLVRDFVKVTDFPGA